MRIALDVMGSDYGPEEIIAGGLNWLAENEHQVVFVGDRNVIEKQTNNTGCDPIRVNIVHASEVITMHESPAIALRKKKDASIVIASHLVRENKADAIVSCGSTGAQMAAGVFIIGRITGVERPPIVAAIPNAAGRHTLLIDAGANVDCNSRQLLQFALLGKIYASTVMGISNPRIALLNNGTEETKGNNLTVETYSLLHKQAGLNFIGNIEGRDLFSDNSDVVVCDGFIGNILLKTIEGAALFMAKALTRELGFMPALFDKLDYTRTGGVPLLGINGISIVCHGSSKREAVKNAMNIAVQCINNNMVKLQQLALSSNSQT